MTIYVLMLNDKPVYGGGSSTKPFLRAFESYDQAVRSRRGLRNPSITIHVFGPTGNAFAIG